MLQGFQRGLAPLFLLQAFLQGVQLLPQGSGLFAGLLPLCGGLLGQLLQGFIPGQQAFHFRFQPGQRAVGWLLLQRFQGLAVTLLFVQQLLLLGFQLGNGGTLAFGLAQQLLVMLLLLIPLLQQLLLGFHGLLPGLLPLLPLFFHELQLGFVLRQPVTAFRQPLFVFLGMAGQGFQLLFQVAYVLIQPLPLLLQVGFFLFQPAQFGHGLITFVLNPAMYIMAFQLLRAQLFQAGFLLAQGGGGCFQGGFRFPQAGGILCLPLTGGLPGPRGPLGNPEAQFLLVLLVAFRRPRLPLQLGQAFVQLLAQIQQPFQVFTGVAHAVFRLPPPLLVAGDAGRFFQIAAQLFRTGFHDTADHALFDDGIAAWPQARAQEQVGDIPPAAAVAVEKIHGLAIPADHSLDRNLVVAGVFSADGAVTVVEHQFHLSGTHRLAAAGAGEDHITHGSAAQHLGRAFPQHPAHGVDDVGFATAIGAHHANEVGGQQQCGGVHKGFEPRKLDLGQSHGIPCSGACY